MEENKKHILIGSGLIVLFFLFLGGIAAAAYLPGFSGEVGRLWLALITSPFLMETALFFLALTLLFAINGWRRNRDGDDWVSLDEKGLPKKDK
jgi:ABC-type spermidine/putrescine transport system permease subunit I